MVNIKTPVVILNFKTYLEASGEKALELAKALESAADESGIQMMAAPQACDIYRIKEETSIPILSQHIDNISPGSHTGSTLFDALIGNGIDGSLLNHSEKRLTLADIHELNQKLKDNDLISCICTNNVETSVAAASFSPDIVAIEPPQLIGTGISVSQAEPEVVKGTVDKVKAVNKDVKVLCGAGISTGEDMRSAIDLGAEGVLLASGIVKAKDPRNALIELVSKL